MTFPSGIYAPPGVYTKTLYESPTQGLLEGLRLPVFIGTGSEALIQEDLELIRGSSSSVDQQVVDEDMDGRAVTSALGAVTTTLGDFDGTYTRIQVRNYPIVRGDGTGTTTTSTADVSVTINNEPIVVLAMDGTTGILTLSTSPESTDTVRCTYYFNRTDTSTTDDVSDQTSTGSAILRGGIGQSYVITADVNDELVMYLDNSLTATTITLSAGTWTAAEIAVFINSGLVVTDTLVASTFVNNYGNTCVLLTADHDITIGTGSANSTLGFAANQTSGRNKTFYVFNGPIVDGTNGGVTTTDTSDVTVLVNGTQVIPSSVDGSNRAVTLAQAPADGATVTIAYYFNTWQDTFDYLAHINITDVNQCGISPGRSDYTDGTDFVLNDDKILWGTATTVTAGTHTTGTTYFSSTQISGTLVDAKTYLDECTAVVNSSVSPPTESRTQFTLPFVPTTGNGRNSPLGTSVFQSVANDRIDLPTNQPSLVVAYWGYSVTDALNRGAVTVTEVDSSNTSFTLKDAVPPGATVYATFYYNTLIDQEYTLTVGTPGAAGVGTYTMANEAGSNVLTPQWGTKSAGLASITVQFPSGAEQTADVRFETPGTTTLYAGPVEETVTVTFANTDSTLGKFTVDGSGPYDLITSASDQFRVLIDGSALASGATGIDLSNVNVAGLGFHATLVGTEVVYDADSGQATYAIDATNDEINLTVDGVLLQGTAATGATVTCANYAAAINTAAAATAPEYYAATKFTSNTTITLNEYDRFIFHYTGDVAGLSGNRSVILTPATYSSATTLAAQVQAAITAEIAALVIAIPNMAGLAITVTANSEGQLNFALTQATADASGYLEFITQPSVAATGTMTVSGVPNVGDQVELNGVTLTGVAGVPGALQFQQDVGTPNGVALSIIAGFTAAGEIPATVTAIADGAGVITYTAAVAGEAGNLLTTSVPTNVGAALAVSGATLAGGSDSPANDFAILAGISTAAATAGTQVKLVDGPIARRFTVTGDSTSALLWDRLVLRNRLTPGGGSMYPQHSVAQAYIEIEGSTGTTETGLAVGQLAYGAYQAAVQPATALSVLGFSDGQVAAGTYGDAKDGQPYVTFYSSGGTTSQNNVLKFTMDGVAVNVEFTDILGNAIAPGGSANVPLGPTGTIYTVLNQIAAAMATSGFGANAAAVIAAGLIYQEGAGVRLVSAQTGTTSSIVIGTGNANTRFGLADGATYAREQVSPEVLSSALMARSAATVAATQNSWATPTATYFAAEALASVVTDAGGADYLYLQSQGGAGFGTLSSVAMATATTDDVMAATTGLEVAAGDGGAGEAGISGFFVTSTDATDGSGTANTSFLNSGTGQDGVVGQTYRDLVTGLTFSILTREGGSTYPSGQTVTFNVRAEVTTDSNIPTNAIPGLELAVTNTNGVGEGDTAIVATYERGGSQPAIGDVYYASYTYTKQDFSAGVYTKFATVEAIYGALGTENPVTLAAYMAMINGAVLVGVKQVQKDANSTTAAVSSYTAAIDDLEGQIIPGVYPDILVPLRSDSTDLFDYLTRHCDIQSSIRYRAERTAIAGLQAGTQPKQVGPIAQAIGRTRFRLVYPDMVTLSMPAADGADQEVLVDGGYLAAGLSGAVTSPNVDVATPWTGRKLFGYVSLGRVLDAVEQNQVAVNGVTIIEDRSTYLRVRQGLTTDVSSILTKLPTIAPIVDTVQQQTRATLDRFVGIKFLPGILSQIEGQLSNTLKKLVDAQILSAYTGISANVSADDPTVAEIEAYIAPVFPLLYLVVTFNLRSSLSGS